MSINKNNNKPDSDSNNTLNKNYVQEVVTGCSNQLSYDDQVHAAHPIMKD